MSGSRKTLSGDAKLSSDHKHEQKDSKVTAHLKMMEAVGLDEVRLKEIRRFLDEDMLEAFDRKLKDYYQYIRKKKPEFQSAQLMKRQFGFIGNSEIDPVIVCALIAAELDEQKKFHTLINHAIENEISLNQLINKQKETILHIAVIKRYAESVELMITQSDVVATLDINIATPLRMLITDMVEQHEEKNIHILDYKIITLLMTAISSDDVIAFEDIITLKNVKNITSSQVDFYNRILTIYKYFFDQKYLEIYNEKMKAITIVENKASMEPKDFNLLNKIIDQSDALYTKINRIIREKNTNKDKKTNDSLSPIFDAAILECQDMNAELIELKAKSKLNQNAIDNASRVINRVNDLIDYIEVMVMQDYIHDKNIIAAYKKEYEKLTIQLDEIEVGHVAESKYVAHDEIVILKYISLLDILRFSETSQSNADEASQVKAEWFISLQNQALDLLDKVIELKHSKQKVVEEKLSTSSSSSIAREAINYSRKCILFGNTITVFKSSMSTVKRQRYNAGVSEVRNVVDKTPKTVHYEDENKDIVYVSVQYDQLLDSIVDLNMPYPFSDLQRKIELNKKYSLGNCYEMARAALDYIVMHNFTLNAEDQIYAEICSVENGDHVFLLIGREYRSDIDVPEKWGRAIVCDPWANKVYDISEYKEQLRNYYYDQKLKRYFLKKLGDDQYLTIIPSENTVILGQRNSNIVLSNMLKLFKIKLTDFGKSLNILISKLQTIQKGTQRKFKKNNLLNFLINTKIETLQKIAKSILPMSNISLETLLSERKSDKDEMRKDDYMFLNTRLQRFLASNIQNALSVGKLTPQEQKDLMSKKGRSSFSNALFSTKLKPTLGEIRSCMEQFNSEIIKLKDLSLLKAETKDNNIDMLETKSHSKAQVIDDSSLLFADLEAEKYLNYSKWCDEDGFSDDLNSDEGEQVDPSVSPPKINKPSKS